jgi:8-oxo-dGTP pyrophosphatase MutT (NUDIX family)
VAPAILSTVPTQNPRLRNRPVARIIVVDPTQRVLLFDTQLAYTRVWMMPGGGVQPGETFEAAAKRELWEEVGIAETPLSPCVWTVRFRFRYGDSLFDQLERYFATRVPAATLSDSNWEGTEREEIKGYRWWSAAEIARSPDDFRPRGLATLLPAILTGTHPNAPISALVEASARVE